MIQREDTKHLFANSMHELSRQKTVEKITVVDITKNCSLSRESFYYHFKDKYDLISWMFITSFDIIMDRFNNYNDTWENSLIAFLKYLKAHVDFFSSALLDSKTNNFFDSFFSYTVDAMVKSVMARYSLNRLSEGWIFQLRFYAHGAVNMATEWLIHKAPTTAEITAHSIVDSMSPLMRELFP